MLKREWGAESNGKLPHLFIPSKTAVWVPEYAGGRPAFEQNCGLGSWVCSEGPGLGQNSMMMILLTNLTTDLSQRLQRVHNACVSFICNTRKYDHVSPSFEELGWLRLQEWRYIHSLVLLYNILNTPTPTYLSTRFYLLSSYHDLSTLSRHDPILSMPSHRTSQYTSSFTTTVSHSWNSLPSSLRNCQNIYQFKSSLFRHAIINSPFL